jgi:hypothetical protein
MMKKQGRPAASRHVRVTPEFLEKPDIEKLARVLLMIAQKLAVEEQEGDAMK